MEPQLKPVRTNDQGFGRAPYEAAPEVAYSTAQGQKVLRNTYLLLAATMVPTVIGAFIGIQTASVIMAAPMVSSLVMLAAVIGLQYAIAANRNSGIGIALLLLMTGILGWWLGPILNFALALEYLQASFYTEAEQVGALRGALAHQAQVVGTHERAHVKAFKQLLGPAAIKQPAFNFHGVTESPDAFRRTAVAFEDLATAAYKGQAPLIKSRSYLAGALAIHSVEARHAAWIRRLAGFLPAAQAFDEPLNAAKVVQIVNSTHFVTLKVPHTSMETNPRFIG